MVYESVDKLQNALVEQVFHYTQNKKKAAGRALGTIVEIITYYLLKTWGFNNSTSIERGIIEYGNEDISHNVEYSLHPIINDFIVNLPNNGNSITANKILKELGKQIDTTRFTKKNNNLLDKHNILRNACTKVKMDIKADEALLKYFSNNINNIETWFNIITPEKKSICDLRNEIAELRTKDWRTIL